jgi:hypothetical protein
MCGFERLRDFDTYLADNLVPVMNEVMPVNLTLAKTILRNVTELRREIERYSLTKDWRPKPTASLPIPPSRKES